MFWCLLRGQKAEKVEKKQFVQAPGNSLLLLGSWIRFQSFGMVSILAFGFWLARAVGVLKTREWKQFLVCDCLPCIIAFSCVFGSIAAENVLVYTPGSQEEHYREYDKARQRLLDTVFRNGMIIRRNMRHLALQERMSSIWKNG